MNIRGTQAILRHLVIVGTVSALAGMLWTRSAARADTPPPSVAPASVCSDSNLALQCPDLVMSAPSHLEIDRSTQPGRDLLRAASSINNHGAGPLEVIGVRDGAAMRTWQVIYDQAGQRHVLATAARLVFKYVPGYRYDRGAVGNFRYWKFHLAASFSLWSVDAGLKAVALVRGGPKLDYCLRDLRRTAPTARSPTQAVYPACRRQATLLSDVLGTSVGWSDVYPYEYPQQWIDVTGLRGSYAYVQTVDPAHLLNEASTTNNVSETYVDLPSGRVLGHRVEISQP